MIDYFFRWTGNFGLAILIVTVLVKILFFPALPNKSYASMAKMKAVQPEMVAIRERYGDDKMKQQQALMELVQEGEDQPARRLPADRGADPGVLRALQGAVRDGRDAPRAKLCHPTCHHEAYAAGNQLMLSDVAIRAAAVGVPEENMQC